METTKSTRLLLAVMLFTLILAPQPGAAVRLLGVYSGIPLYQGTAYTHATYTLTLGEGAHALLWATIPSPRIQEILSRIPVMVAPVKRVEPVETPWGVLYWGIAPSDATHEPVSDEKPLMVILVPNETYRWFAEELAKLHRGIRVRIVTWSDVLHECRGGSVKAPPGTVKPEELKKACGTSYNLTKALCLIGFERRLLHEGLRYLLILGDARVSPPIYYRSPLLSTIGIRCGEYVPSDYWFVDPDYDWKPEVAVGRIPFLDRESLEAYLEAARDWVGWRGRASGLYAGGAPFQTFLMMGELGVIEASQTASGLSRVEVQTLTLENYEPLSVQSRVGDYGLYYIASHGVGDVLLDVFPKGLWGAKVDLVLAPKLLGKRLGFHPGVYVTPACLSAYWDYDVIEPSFNPPSVGVALLEKGYAAAYYGSSRVAVAAIVKLEGSAGGTLGVKNIGALKLTALVASMLTQSRTIGEAVVKALAAYSSLARGIGIAYTPAGSEDVAELTMLEFLLLGDPALPSPSASGSPAVHPAPSMGYNLTVPVSVVAPILASMSEGSLPLVKNKRLLFIRVKGECPIEAKLVAVRRYNGYYLAEIVEEPARMYREGGYCVIRGVVDAGPSLHYLVLRYGDSVARYILLAAGLRLDTMLGKLSISAYGLDLLRVTGDEPIGVYVNGELISWIPGAVDKVNMTIPASGDVRITLRPWRQYIGVVAGRKALVAYESIVSRVFSGEARVPRLEYRLSPSGVILEAVGGTISVEGASSVARIAPGTYLVIPAPTARSINVTLRAGGHEYSITIPVVSVTRVNLTSTPAATTTTTTSSGSCTVQAETIVYTRTTTRTLTVTVTREAGGLTPASVAAVMIIAGIVAFAVVYAGVRGR